MPDLTVTTMTEDQLWLMALQHLQELVHLLAPDHRNQPVPQPQPDAPVLTIPYWLAVSMNIGALTAITRELSQRSVTTH